MCFHFLRWYLKLKMQLVHHYHSFRILCSLMALIWLGAPSEQYFFESSLFCFCYCDCSKSWKLIQMSFPSSPVETGWAGDLLANPKLWWAVLPEVHRKYALQEHTKLAWARREKVAGTPKGPSPKSLDSDENFKPYHTILCHDIKICCDLRTFWSKKVFWG